MKRFIMFILFIINISTGYSQTSIDSSNYYSFLDKNESIYWMSREEVAPILEEELKRNGYLENDFYSLMKLDSSQYVVLLLYNRDINLGFIYPQIHEYPPKKKHRQMRSSDKESLGFDYGQRVETLNTRPIFIKIKQLPDNIIILNEDCYWYQDEIPNKKMVTKSMIIKILRQDIRFKLSQFEKMRKK